MKKVLALLLVFFFLDAFIASMPSMAHASSQTIVVPDDYATIETAIGNANNGDKILVKSGTYLENPINTTKSLSLIGASNQSPHLSITSPATVENFYGYNITTFGRAINVSASNFTLSGFNIETNGGDIFFSGNYTTITNNHMAAPFTANGGYLNINNNTFLRAHFSSGWGVNFNYHLDMFLSFSNFSNNVVSYDNNMCTMTIGGYYDVITNNSISGTKYLGIGSTPCFLSGNKISGLVAPFSVSSANSIITKNSVDNVAYGFGDDGSNNTIFANEIMNCNEPFGDTNQHFPLTTAENNVSNLFYGNNFINNSCPIHGIYSNKIDSFDNGALGNYWSDYAAKYPDATEVDNTGVWNTPYTVLTANGTDLYPLTTPFDISAAPDLLPNWAKTTSTSTFPSLPTIAVSVVIVFVVVVAVVAVSLLVYFKRRKH